MDNKNDEIKIKFYLPQKEGKSSLFIVKSPSNEKFKWKTFPTHLEEIFFR